MATTPNYSFTLLDVGQTQKEATINLGLTAIDTLLFSPTLKGTSFTFKNGSLTVATLNATATPSATTDLTQKSYVDAKGYQGEHTADPATTGLLAGATYYNTSSSQLKFLNSSLAWTVR